MELRAKALLEKKRLEKKQWDLRDAALAAAILASGMWLIIAGLTKSWGEYKSRTSRTAFRVYGFHSLHANTFT